MDSDIVVFFVTMIVFFGAVGGILYGAAWIVSRFTAPAPGTRRHLEQRPRLAEQDQIVANHRRDIADALGDVRVDRPSRETG